MKNRIVIKLALWLAGLLAAMLGFISWLDFTINTLFFDELFVMLIGGAFVWLVKVLKQAIDHENRKE